MKQRTVWCFGLLLGAFWLGAGCNEDSPSTWQGDETPTGKTNIVPASLSGKSYTFSVTGSQRFTEPFDSGYTIDFPTETTYVLHPLGQNNLHTTDRQGNYLYSLRIGVVHFVETAPDSGRAFDAALTFSAPDTGTAHLTGQNGATQDAIFFQTNPSP